MLNLDKFNTDIDLKNLDATQITQALAEHQNTLIKLFVIGGALFVAGMMFNDHRIKDQNMRSKMSQVQEKLQAISASEEAVQELAKFKTSLPQRLSESDLITLISNYAKSNNVIITSLSPAESKDMGLYDAVDVTFDASADNFKDMMIFIRKLETSETPIMINTWAGHEEIDGKITFSLEISNVVIHT